MRRSFISLVFISVQPTPNPMCVLMSVPHPHKLMHENVGTVEQRKEDIDPESGAARRQRSSSKRRTVPCLLASRLLHTCPDIAGVLVGSDFVSVEKVPIDDGEAARLLRQHEMEAAAKQPASAEEGPTAASRPPQNEEEHWDDIRAHTMAVLMEYIMCGDAAKAVKEHELRLAREEFEGTAASDAHSESETYQVIAELVNTVVRPLLLRDGGDMNIDSYDAEEGVLRVELLGACRKCPNAPNTLRDSVERILQHYVPELARVVDVVSEEEEAARKKKSESKGKGIGESDELPKSV
eukprot:PhM_4_TR1960/c0_g1_i1/m.96289/K22074/NFU1, HIRIP5; NFU1 iron-sulfur cluster scaffold homolog, mitochondrial